MFLLVREPLSLTSHQHSPWDGFSPPSNRVSSHEAYYPLAASRPWWVGAVRLAQHANQTL